MVFDKDREGSNLQFMMRVLFVPWGKILVPSSGQAGKVTFHEEVIRDRVATLH